MARFICLHIKTAFVETYLNPILLGKMRLHCLELF